MSVSLSAFVRSTLMFSRSQQTGQKERATHSISGGKNLVFL